MSSLLLTSCKKDARVPPSVQFKTTSGYTSSAVNVAKGAQILVGITASKTEDELKTFNVSVSYDGAAANSVETTQLTSAQEESYNRDYTIQTRNQAGTEQWIFTVTDRDGNMSDVKLTLTVQ